MHLGRIGTKKGAVGIGLKQRQTQQPAQRQPQHAAQFTRRGSPVDDIVAPAASARGKPEFGVASDLPALSVCRLEAREDLLKKLKHHLDDPALADFQCPICWDPFWQPVRTVCGHAFCESCLLKSVLAQLGLEQPDVSCPMCRHPLHVDDVAVDQALVTRIRMVLAEKGREDEYARPPPSRGGRVMRGLTSAPSSGIGSSRPGTSNGASQFAGASRPSTADTSAASSLPGPAHGIDPVMASLFAPGCKTVAGWTSCVPERIERAASFPDRAATAAGLETGIAASTSANRGGAARPGSVSIVTPWTSPPRTSRTAQSGRSAADRAQRVNDSLDLGLVGVAPPGGVLGEGAVASTDSSQAGRNLSTKSRPAGWIRVALSSSSARHRDAQPSQLLPTPPRSAPTRAPVRQHLLQQGHGGRLKSSPQAVEDHFPGPSSADVFGVAGDCEDDFGIGTPMGSPHADANALFEAMTAIELAAATSPQASWLPLPGAGAQAVDDREANVMAAHAIRRPGNNSSSSSSRPIARGTNGGASQPAAEEIFADRPLFVSPQRHHRPTTLSSSSEHGAGGCVGRFGNVLRGSLARQSSKETPSPAGANHGPISVVGASSDSAASSASPIRQPTSITRRPAVPTSLVACITATPGRTRSMENTSRRQDAAVGAGASNNASTEPPCPDTVEDFAFADRYRKLLDGGV